MPFYDEMRDIASSLIKEFKQGTVAYIEYVAPDGATPDEPGEPVPRETPLDAVARGVAFKYVDNSLVLRSDMQCTFAAGTVTPNLDGFMSVDGVQYKIVQAIPKPAAGDPVAWTVIFRR